MSLLYKDLGLRYRIKYTESYKNSISNTCLNCTLQVLQNMVCFFIFNRNRDFRNKFVRIIRNSIVDHSNLARCAGNLHFMVIDIIYQFPVIDICFVVAAAKTDRNAEFFRMLFYFTVIGVFFVQDKKNQVVLVEITGLKVFF